MELNPVGLTSLHKEEIPKLTYLTHAQSERPREDTVRRRPSASHAEMFLQKPTPGYLDLGLVASKTVSAV